jgi:hypothetical protein
MELDRVLVVREEWVVVGVHALSLALALSGRETGFLPITSRAAVSHVLVTCLAIPAMSLPCVGAGMGASSEVASMASLGPANSITSSKS